MRKILYKLVSPKVLASLVMLLGLSAGVWLLAAPANASSTVEPDGIICDTTGVCGYIKNGGSKSIKITCQFIKPPGTPTKQRTLYSGQSNKTKPGCKDADGFYVPKGYVMEKRYCEKGYCWWQRAYKYPGPFKNGWYKIIDVESLVLRRVKA